MTPQQAFLITGFHDGHVTKLVLQLIEIGCAFVVQSMDDTAFPGQIGEGRGYMGKAFDEASENCNKPIKFLSYDKFLGFGKSLTTLFLSLPTLIPSISSCSP